MELRVAVDQKPTRYANKLKYAIVQMVANYAVVIMVVHFQIQADVGIRNSHVFHLAGGQVAPEEALTLRPTAIPAPHFNGLEHVLQEFEGVRGPPSLAGMDTVHVFGHQEE